MVIYRNMHSFFSSRAGFRGLFLVLAVFSRIALSVLFSGISGRVGFAG
jgi:hypothetical protein